MTDESELQLRIDKIVDEYLAARKAGDKPSIAEFAARFPDIEISLRETLQTILFVEDLKTPDETELASKGRLSGEFVPDIADYRINRKIGQGGMGVVYEAVQESLGRRVALKVLPSGLGADSTFVERFEREARAAAQLHHTNIVPVFDVGRSGDTLYYAMQFIDGATLDEVQEHVALLRDSGSEAASSSISNLMLGSSSGKTASGKSSSPGAQNQYFKSVASLGASVADALAYAHHRQIIHRDVKPSNLILDNQGVVWLTDFGLAKTSDSDLTETGDFLGTARYMSPERFKGQDDQRVDVYGLGVTLYELVTLRRPFDAANRMQLMEQIANVEPRRPQEIDRRIPLDLETIILKSMAKEPRRRYQNCAEQADDLRRFMDGQPIEARRSTVVERAILWMKRNRSQTVAMFSMAASIGILFFSALAILNQKKVADENFAEAIKQQQLADENFQLAFDAVDEYFTQVSQETLLEEPGMEDLRSSLLGSAKDFYDQFLKLRKDDPLVQAEYFGAGYRSAIIKGTTESKDDAIEQLHELIEYASALNEKDFDAEMFYRVSLLHLTLGRYLLDQGKLEEGFESLRKAEDLGQRSVAADPGSWRYPLGLNTTFANMARCYATKGNYEEALDISKKARQTFDRIDADQLNEFEVWVERGLANRMIGVTYQRTGAYEDAIKQYSLAIDDYDRAEKIKPGSQMIRRYMANVFGARSGMKNRIGQSDEALKDIEKSIEMLKTLVSDFPRNTNYQYDLANRLASLGTIYWSKSEFSEALTQYESAMELRKRLVSNHPKNINYLVRLGRIHQNLAVTYEKLGRQKEREEYYLKTLEYCKRVYALQPENPQLLSELIRCRSGLCNLYASQRKFEVADGFARDSFQQALECYRSSPHVIEFGLAVAESAVSLGELLNRQEKFADAIDIFKQGIAIGKETLTRANNNQPIRRQIWAATLSMGECQLRLSKLDKALANKKASSNFAVDEYRKLVSLIQVSQMEAMYSGKAEDNVELDSIPADLLESRRIQTELAYFSAAKASAVAASAEDDADFEKNMADCVSHLNRAQDLEPFGSAELKQMLAHPFFTSIRDQDSLLKWKQQVEQSFDET